MSKTALPLIIVTANDASTNYLCQYTPKWGKLNKLQYPYVIPDKVGIQMIQQKNIVPCGETFTIFSNFYFRTGVDLQKTYQDGKEFPYTPHPVPLLLFFFSQLGCIFHLFFKF